MSTRINHRRIHAGCGVTVLLGVTLAACGSAVEPSTFDGGASGPAPTGSGSGGGSATSLLIGTPNLADAGGGGAATDTRCSGGAQTTISGTVYDPAVQNPLYNVTVFIPDPASTPPTFARTGASCSACTDLYPSAVTAVGVTDEKGHFTLSMSAGGPLIPVGSNVPLYVQTGKWRMKYTILDVAACVDNPQPDKSLHLPVDSTEGDLPDVAISTGGADSLECLPMRIGVNPAEYTAGGSMNGHIHIYRGAGGATTSPAAPASYAELWDKTADLQKNDVVLLSCEGQETSNLGDSNRQSLEEYANAGGRVFASHFHYSWFDQGAFAADNLATWTRGPNAINDTASFDADVVTALNVGGAPFPEGIALEAWLGNVGALTGGQLPIWYARHNANVTMTNTASQPWITFGDAIPRPGTNSTQYFSFDTPIGAAAPDKCGRVVYSDLHVSGGPRKPTGNVTPDYEFGGLVAPSGCAKHPLTPQEKALEFMLFDLSSCLQTVGQPQQVVQLPQPK